MGKTSLSNNSYLWTKDTSEKINKYLSNLKIVFCALQANVRCVSLNDPPLVKTIPR